MRLHRYISPVLCILILFGFCVNTDNFNPRDYNIDEVLKPINISAANSLKEDLDDYIKAINTEFPDIDTSGQRMVEIAKAQLGNVGGEKYWRWYGMASKCAWCAIFVSWVANECGYIESGAVPMFASVPYGVEWYKSRGLFMEGGKVPSPGMIIFFDFEDYDHGIYWINDGRGDHVGIVEKVEDGVVYTIEGNNGDMCRERTYPINSQWILGYGTPNY